MHLPLQLLLLLSAELVSAGGIKGFEGCTNGQKKWITKAYEDAITIANTGLPIDWNGRAAKDFFGPEEFSENFRSRIEKNLEAAAKWPQGTEDITIRCDGETCNSARGKLGQGSVAGFAESFDEKTKTAMPIIYACDPFYGFSTLAQITEGVALSLNNQMDYRYLKNSGMAFLHEMMHLTSVAGKDNEAERIRDYLLCKTPSRIFAYGPQNTRLLARKGRSGARSASVNADNYAWYANASYFRILFGVFATQPELPKEACPAPGPDPSAQPVDVEVNLDGSIREPAAENPEPAGPQLPPPRPPRPHM